MKWQILAILVVLTVAIPTQRVQADAAKIPVLLDTDLGSDVDDAFALGLVVASPELELVGVTTVGQDAEDRAWMVCRFLTQVGVKQMPVAFGAAPQPEGPIDWQIQYRRHPAAIFNRTLKPLKESAVELMAHKLKERPGEITLLCVGPLTNVARLLKEHPEAKKWIRQVVLLGGSVAVGYDGKKQPEPEWNLRADVAAAKAVFSSDVPLTVVPLDASGTLRLDRERRERLFAARSMLTYQIQNLYELWDRETPILFDAAAVAATFDPTFFTFKDLHLKIDDRGMSAVGNGKANARTATAVKEGALLDWVVERLRRHGPETLPADPGHRSRLIEPGAFPVRVHSWEDYETDIEKRWWMSGKAETKDVPQGSRRACRAVLTQDFDDRQGDLKTMYRAVIFNPVPGPPMGPNTRLRFRYKLHGTDTIRVQLYSLTNGYHRYLSVNGLKQDEWTDAAVDMTAMRRPDGSGGPLAADERIDDIQFYIDPRAELLIDDVVLYEAAADGEKRPFPSRLLYTGWFDTGKQGKEWPGDFEIIAHEKPRTWKTAKSVASSDGTPWIRLHLRGERAFDAAVELFFRYRVRGAEQMEVELFHGNDRQSLGRRAVKLAADQWAETTATFAAPTEKGRSVDEIRFHLPAGSELLLDDVLLYEPGRARD